MLHPVLPVVLAGCLWLGARWTRAPRSVPLPDERAASPRQARGELRVVSLNLGHGRGPARSHLATGAHRHHLDAVAALLRREAPDVVTLQEADGPSSWSGGFDHVAHLARATGMAAAHGHHVVLPGARYGTALLGADRLDHALAHTFGVAGPTPSKGFTLARVHLDGRPLDVVSLHLDFAIAAVRRRQLAELGHVLASRGHPVVVMGDFNAEPAALAPLLARLGLHTLPAGVSFPRLGGTIDHVAASRELALHRVDVLPDGVSDHRALRATLAWRDAA